MTRFARLALPAAATATALLAAACTTAPAPEPTPEEYLGLGDEALTGAELDSTSFAELATPLAPADLAAVDAVRFAADPALAEDGDATLLIGEHAPPGPGERSLRDAVVAIRWGYFPPRPADAWRDWSGFIAVVGGDVELIRPLRFENDLAPPARPAEDFVRPAGPGGRALRIRSHTAPAWDGVLVRVRRPSLRPAALVIHLGGVTRVLPFEELGTLAAVEQLDADGHELRLDGRAAFAEHPCVMPVAQAAGEWRPGGPEDGLLRGMISPPVGPLAIAGVTVEELGPYGRFHAVVRDQAGAVGAAHGIYAQFRYSPGGMLLGRAFDGDAAWRGGLLGHFAAGDWQAVVLQRDPACAP